MTIQPLDIAPIDDASMRTINRSQATATPARPADQEQAVTEPNVNGPGPEAKDPPPVSAYASPVIRFDGSSGIAVLQFRDGDTGSVQAQVPSQRAIMEYREQMRAVTKGGTKQSA